MPHSPALHLPPPALLPCDFPPDSPGGPLSPPLPGTGERHVILPPTATCNGWSTQEQRYCKQPAGAGTPHKGAGRCEFHDTSAATTAYLRLRHLSRTAIGSLALELESTDPQPTDILSELHLVRATLLHWVQRYEIFCAETALWAKAYASGDVFQPPPVVDLGRIDQFAKRVAELALQVEESRLKDAISQGELIEILREVGSVVELTVTTCPHCRQPLAPVLDLIKAGWQRIQLWGRRAKKKD